MFALRPRIGIDVLAETLATFPTASIAIHPDPDQNPWLLWPQTTLYAAVISGHREYAATSRRLQFAATLSGRTEKNLEMMKLLLNHGAPIDSVFGADEYS